MSDSHSPDSTDATLFLSFRLLRGLNVGADVDTLHDLVVTQDGVSEEDFRLAFAAAQLRKRWLEEGPPTTRR